jgi:hypothetical protein
MRAFDLRPCRAQRTVSKGIQDGKLIMLVDPSVLAAQEQARAAWVQVWIAVGQGVLTIAALGIAIAVPSWQDRRAKAQRDRDRFIEGRELANVILPAVRDWAIRVAFLAQHARVLRVADVYDRHEKAFQIPLPIAEQVGRLATLGEAALPLQDALHLASSSTEMWDSYDEAARGDVVGDAYDHAIHQAHNTIYQMKGLLLVASTALGLFFDSSGRQLPNAPWDYLSEVVGYVRDDKLREADAKVAQ